MVRFQGEDQQVEIARKQKPDGSVKAPAVGDKLPGSIQTKENGMLKFKQDYSASGYSGGSTGGSQAKGDSPSPEYWASKDSRISRMASQRTAIQATDLEVKAGTFKPTSTEEVAKRIKSWVVKLEADLPELADE